MKKVFLFMDFNLTSCIMQHFRNTALQNCRCYKLIWVNITPMIFLKSTFHIFLTALHYICLNEYERMPCSQMLNYHIKSGIVYYVTDDLLVISFSYKNVH